MRSVIPFVFGLTVACETRPDGPTSSAREVAQTADWTDDPRENAVLQVVAEAEATLMGSDGPALAVGLKCGLAPWPSVRPWFAVRYLLAARHEERLRRIVDEAPTTEGRIWAAHGLVAANQLDDRHLTEIADEAEAAVWICDGCVNRLGTAAEAVEYLQSPTQRSH